MFFSNEKDETIRRAIINLISKGVKYDIQHLHFNIFIVVSIFFLKK